MPTRSPSLALDFDETGFLLHPDAWSRLAAEQIAAADGIHLTDLHWALINSLRNYYFRLDAPPSAHYICHLHNLEPRCIERLFGDEREAWRIAGLPDPGEEAKAYM